MLSISKNRPAFTEKLYKKVGLRKEESRLIERLAVDDATAAKLDSLFATRKGRIALKIFFAAFRNRFGPGFNQTMLEVDAEDIRAALVKPLLALTGKAKSGRIVSCAQLNSLQMGILSRTALYYRTKAKRRANPVVRRSAKRDLPGKAHDELRLFAPVEYEPNRYAAQGCNPTHPAERAELFGLILRESRWLGPLRFRIFREVREYERRHGTRHGAFTSLAKRAVVDDQARLVRIQPADPNRELANHLPPRRIVRQIRERYFEACQYIENRAFFLGYRVPPLT